MIVACPSCGEKVDQTSAPKRGPTMDGNEMWLCLRCPAVVCIHCYHDHGGKQHPDMYQKQPTGGSQKNKKGKRR